MALLQISEPGCAPAPHQHKRAVGIDLGTTYSLVATMQSGQAKIIEDEAGRSLLPSVVHFGTEGVSVGYPAISLGQEDPLNCIYSIKRLMGRGATDINRVRESLPFKLGKPQTDSLVPHIATACGPKTAVEISSLILTRLKARAELALAGDIEGAVITVPAYFDEAQRQATKDAARLAGIPVLRLLSEPTAAAIAYGLDRREDSLVAVFDLGGGTFDFSLLHLQNGIFEVIAVGGDAHLGGDDFDHCIADWILDSAQIDDLADTEVGNLLAVAKRAKEKLTHQSEVKILWPSDLYGEIALTLSRQQFDSMVRPLVEKAVQVCRRTLNQAQLETDEIAQVVLVGGATRVPLVQQAVADCFNKTPLTDLDPDTVVALGAAIQADVLIGNQPDTDLLLLDVVPLSLGIETMGGLVEKIIPRNATLPIAKAQQFTTYKDGQTALTLHVLQGERELADECRSLARFILHGIPPMTAGAARIEVRFELDADGLLQVSARELSSGVENRIEVKPSYGLSDVEIETMLRESIAQGGQDMQLRQLREAQVDAQRLLEALHTAIQEDGEQLLSAEERLALEEAMQDLNQVLSGDSLAAIKQSIDTLENLSDPFAARRMNHAVSEALSGHKLEEFQDD